GAAMLVPPMVFRNRPPSPFQVLRMSWPGAATWLVSVLRWLEAARRSRADSRSTTPYGTLELAAVAQALPKRWLTAQVLATLSVEKAAGTSAPAATNWP